ncbi:MAG: hypothetical protein ACRBC3_05720 [Burkholderiaceae bacterium]
MPHHIFVYFKTPATARDQTNSLVRRLSLEQGRGLPVTVQCSRRVDPAGASASDTWLEHYQCPDEADATRLLQRLSRLDPEHPLLQLTIDGLAGRHVEHFLCA